MNNITNTLHKALNVINGLTEFELDRSERKAVAAAFPLFETAYQLLTILEQIIITVPFDEMELNKMKTLMNYAKSGFENDKS